MTGPETDPRPAPDEQTDSAEERRESRRNKFVAVGFFLFVILLWLTAHFLNRELTAEAAVETSRARFAVVEIASGSAVADIARKLADNDVISNELFFTVAAIARGSTRDLKAGEYRFETNISLLEALSRLEQGRVLLHEFTIPEGFTVKQIAERLDNNGLAEAEEMMRLAEDQDFCRTLGVESATIEGFLFPDTYRIAKGLSTEDLFRIMVDKMWTVWETETSEAGRPEDWNLQDIMTIASIIEREAMFDDEKPLIASVIYNRLEQNIPLQCDVTIRYPLDNYGVHLTYDDLDLDSPYNSYRNRGIPPTPICSPGLPSIRAALNPAETDNLYFVSMNNGHHKFSSTLKEHNKAVHKYQILNERG
jgi:UPF0755 protein